MYPNLIVDNFFEDPDRIVDLSKNLQYSSSDGEYFKSVDKSTILSGSSKKLSTIKFGYIISQVVFRILLGHILL